MMDTDGQTWDAAALDERVQQLMAQLDELPPEPEYARPEVQVERRSLAAIGAGTDADEAGDLLAEMADELMRANGPSDRAPEASTPPTPAIADTPDEATAPEPDANAAIFDEPSIAEADATETEADAPNEDDEPVESMEELDEMLAQAVADVVDDVDASDDEFVDPQSIIDTAEAPAEASEDAPTATAEAPEPVPPPAPANDAPAVDAEAKPQPTDDGTSNKLQELIARIAGYSKAQAEATAQAIQAKVDEMPNQWRQTLQFVTIILLLNAIAVWGYVLIRKPATPEPATDQEKHQLVAPGAPDEGA